MSKRTGNAITLRELCEDIGVDAARWFFVSKDVATHMDLDLKLARSKVNNNPVYYAQYAYSRMCSILRNPQIPEFKSVDVYERLTDEKELQLLKLISEFPKEVAAVGRIAEMIRELELNPGTMKLIINRAPNGQLQPGHG